MFFAFNPIQPIKDACEWTLEFWHDLIGNFDGSWGWSIILLTFTVRIFILPLTFKGVKSMQRLQSFQPEIKKIQARYKDDKQRMNQEVMAFYQREKVNPLGSCLPLVLQIPFFIALFQLLRSPEFKADIADNPGFYFIDDLADKVTDPVLLGVLIVLYVGTQLAASLVTAISADPTQRRIMLALPFVFVIFIINFQAGLIVYWITTNVWTIGQQLLVKKLYPKPVPAAATEEAGPSPARGKPPAAKPAGAAALADGKAKGDDTPRGDGKTKAKTKTRGGDGGKGASKAATAAGGNGAPAKPPPSPRKKKKRSGRRR
jgi:YidC/Oxa1 family membrane protein insertase